MWSANAGAPLQDVAIDVLLAGTVVHNAGEGTQWLGLYEHDADDDSVAYCPLSDVTALLLEQRPRLYRCFETLKRAGWPGMPQRPREEMAYGLVFEGERLCVYDSGPAAHAAHSVRMVHASPAQRTAADIWACGGARMGECGVRCGRAGVS